MSLSASYINRRCELCNRVFHNNDEVAIWNTVTDTFQCRFCYGKKPHKARHPVWGKKSRRRRDFIFRQRSIADGKRMVRCV